MGIFSNILDSIISPSEEIRKLERQQKELDKHYNELQRTKYKTAGRRMQEAFILIIVLGLIFIGFPWMANNLTFNQQMAVCGILIIASLALPLIHDIMTNR